MTRPHRQVRQLQICLPREEFVSKLLSFVRLARKSRIFERAFGPQILNWPSWPSPTSTTALPLFPNRVRSSLPLLRCGGEQKLPQVGGMLREGGCSPPPRCRAADAGPCERARAIRVALGPGALHPPLCSSEQWSELARVSSLTAPPLLCTCTRACPWPL